MRDLGVVNDSNLMALCKVSFAIHSIIICFRISLFIFYDRRSIIILPIPLKPLQPNRSHHPTRPIWFRCVAFVVRLNLDCIFRFDENIPLLIDTLSSRHKCSNWCWTFYLWHTQIRPSKEQHQQPPPKKVNKSEIKTEIRRFMTIPLPIRRFIQKVNRKMPSNWWHKIKKNKKKLAQQNIYHANPIPKC